MKIQIMKLLCDSLCSAIVVAAICASVIGYASSAKEGDSKSDNTATVSAKEATELRAESKAQSSPASMAESKTDSSPASMAEAKTQPKTESNSSTAAAANSTDLFKQFEALVREYYPKAKLKQAGETMHVEYKTKIYANPATNRNELGPLWGGLVADLELKPGEYQGIEKMPQQLNQYSFYIVMLDAPYSKNANQHLYTRLMYPFDTPPDFLKRYKILVSEFDKYVKAH